MTVSSRRVRIAASWERFRPFMVRKMKNPEGSCQFTKWASLSSLPHSHSSAGMDTAPSRFHFLLRLSTSNLPYIYVSVCVCESERKREQRNIDTDRKMEREMVMRVRALQRFLGIEVSGYSVSPTVIWATSGGANNSAQHAVFAYMLSLMICSTICTDECSV